MKVRQFLVYPYPEEVGLAPSWAAGVIRMKRMKKWSQQRRLGVCWRRLEGKLEIPVNSSFSSVQGHKPTFFSAPCRVSGCVCCSASGFAADQRANTLMLFDNIGSTTRAEQKLQSQPLCLSHIFKSCPGAGSRKGRQHIRSCLPALDVGAVDVSLFCCLPGCVPALFSPLRHLVSTTSRVCGQLECRRG